MDFGRRGTLLGVLDATCTPVGARLLRRWITQPLLHRDAIVARQFAVAELAGRLPEAQLAAAAASQAVAAAETGQLAPPQAIERQAAAEATLGTTDLSKATPAVAGAFGETTNPMPPLMRDAMISEGNTTIL